MLAILLIGLEVVRMPDFENELHYQITMSMVIKMLRDGLITEKEYRQIDTMFIAK